MGRRSIEILTRKIRHVGLMQEGIHTIRHLQRERRAHSVFLVQRCFRINPLIILGSPRDGPHIGFLGEVIRRLFVQHRQFAYLLLRELIPERKAVVEHTEDDIHPNRICGKTQLHLIMMIPDKSFFAPNGLPCRICGSQFHRLQRPMEIA